MSKVIDAPIASERVDFVWYPSVYGYYTIFNAQNAVMAIAEDRGNADLICDALNEYDPMGPLTMEARLYGLQEVLDIQNAINEATPLGHPDFTLIDTEEEARIRELIAANTWPQRWTGDEARADIIQPVRFTRDGGRQMQMLIGEAIDNG